MNELTGLFLIAGSSQSDSDIRYLSNFSAPDPFLFLQTATDNYLIVSPMEKGRAETQSHVGTKVFTPAELGMSLKQRGRVDLQMIAVWVRVYFGGACPGFLDLLDGRLDFFLRNNDVSSDIVFFRC